jgi:hypothetical protein
MGSTSPISPAASDEAALLSTPEADALGAVAAAATCQNAHCQNGRNGQHLFIQFHILYLLLLLSGRCFPHLSRYHTSPVRKSQHFLFSALDARFLFRYNKNELRTHSIATDFKIERNFP